MLCIFCTCCVISVILWVHKGIFECFLCLFEAMLIYGKNRSNIFFSETNRLISMKLGVKHPWLKYYNVYINHDPVMTLTKFMARPTWVAHAFEWEKLLKCHLKGKASKKLANGQNIDYSEKRKRPKGFICPCTGVKYHNIQTCLLVYAADSGERLQDHWSSGSVMLGQSFRFPCISQYYG